MKPAVDHINVRCISNQLSKTTNSKYEVVINRLALSSTITPLLVNILNVSLHIITKLRS